MAREWPVKYAEASDLPEIIPLFPLAGAVFFPRANLPLNIFEPRYLRMVDDAMRSDRIIGMIQPSVAGDLKPELFSVGCAGRIVTYGETDDGRMVISLRGVARFRLTEELSAMTPYRQARVDYTPFGGDFSPIDPNESEALFDRKGYLETLRLYLRTIAVQIDWAWVEAAAPEVLINAFSMLAPLRPEEKQALLEAPTLQDRTQGALTLMQLAIAEGGPSPGPQSGASMN